MAAYFPQSVAALLQITGVGEQKCTQFGEKFLTVIRRYAQQNNIGEKIRQGGIVTGSSHVHAKPIYAGSTHDETKQLLLQKISLTELAKRRGLTPEPIITQMDPIFTPPPRVPFRPLPPPQDRFDSIAAAFAQSKGTALAPVRQILGESYSYDELRLARLFIAANQ